MHAESFSLEIFTNYVALYSFSVHAVWVNPPPSFFDIFSEMVGNF